MYKKCLSYLNPCLTLQFGVFYCSLLVGSTEYKAQSIERTSIAHAAVSRLNASHQPHQLETTPNKNNHTVHHRLGLDSINSFERLIEK